MAKEMGRTPQQKFFQKDIHVANRHMKKYIISHKRYKELQRDIKTHVLKW